MRCRTFGHCRVITPLNLWRSAAFWPTWAEIRLNTLTNKSNKFVWRPKSFSLNMKWKMFACKYRLKFARSRKLEIQNRLECWSPARGCRAIFKWDKARTILSVTHSGTQTLRVTHVVTHCCPPAPLTQLYTSVMGLGAKTAGRRPSPDQTIGGARCCVWEARVHDGTLWYCKLWHFGALSTQLCVCQRERDMTNVDNFHSSPSGTSKSWYCSSVKDFLETTRTLRPSRAMFPH